jgi:serine protease Do
MEVTMGNKIFSFALAAAIILGAVHREDIPSTQANIKTIAESVVKRSVEITAFVDGSQSIGSGVLYEKDGNVFVLTAAHVIGEGKGLYIVEQIDIDDETQTQTWTADVVAYETDSDWAILRLVGDTRCIFGGTTFVHSSPQVGDEVYAVGSPLGEENTISEGIVANPNRTVSWNKDKHFAVTCAGTHGSSGGGIFDTKTGNCIGIVVRMNPYAKLLYVVKIKTILDDLEKIGQLSLFPT